MTVTALLAALRRRRLVLILCALLFPIAAYVAAKQLTPRYTASATVMFEPTDYAARELQSILRDWGYEVLAAGSTDQALERLRADTRKPDIIVADYRLRGGRVGTEAIVKIRELFYSNIPGVILTGETGPECAADAAAHGFSIAHKPITSHQLNVAMEKLLSEAAD